MASTSSKSSSVRKMLAVGDCMLGRLVDDAMTALRRSAQHKAHRLPWLLQGGAGGAGTDGEPGERSTEHATFVWGDMLPLFLSADLRLVNLETSITQHAVKWPGQAFNFKMDPASVAVLKAARVDFCSLANNHVLDFKVEGMRETVGVLDAAGIKHAGCGDSLEEASTPAVLRLGVTPVVVFSAADHFHYWAAAEKTPGIFLLDPKAYTDADVDRLAQLVRAARERARTEEPERRALAVMCFHWGPNYSWQPSGSIRRLAHDLVGKCGFDLILGTSAHHVQGVELYRGTPILYGLGDFVDDYVVDSAFRNDLGFAFVLNWDEEAQKWLHIDLHPTCIHRLRVTSLQSLSDRRWLMEKMTALCCEMGTQCVYSDYGSLQIPLS